VCNTTGVLRLNTEKDIELLRQAALLLERENQRLVAKVVELTRQLMAARGEEKEALQLRLALLEQQLAARTKKLFGDASEKRSGSEQKPGEGAEKKPKEPQTGHGPKAQPELPSVVVEHALDEADKVCPQCGDALELWPGQVETTEDRRHRAAVRAQEAHAKEVSLPVRRLHRDGARSAEAFPGSALFGRCCH
jgi:transposase